MKPMYLRRRVALPLLVALVVPILAACGGTAAPQVIRETVVVEQTAAPIRETVVVEQTVVAEAPTGTAAEAFTTPHPILGDLKVRQAIAYCTNRPELIQSVYGFLTPEQQEGLLMDTFLPKSHWAAATDGITTYPFDAAKGQALLDEAGWVAPEGGGVRTKDGIPLFLEFTTTNAQFRVTWATVLEQQLLNNCGIQISRKHAPGSWWFGDTTGLARRDFELGAYAWVGQADPGGTSLYACNQIPLPSNGWEGQNYMGWCNEAASKAIIAANNTLNRDDRIAQYATVQQEFTKDMVSLPLFNRLEAAAASTNLQNFKPDSTAYYTHNSYEWTLADGGDSLVIGMTQEPASMFSLVESAAVQRTAAYLIGNNGGEGWAYNTLSYDFQPMALTELPTLENGGATNTPIEVSEGDQVWTTDGEAAALAPGVEVVNSDGETVTYESGTVTLNQLAVTFTYPEGIKWEDGEPLKAADFELAYKIDCDETSGAVTYTVCNSISGVDFTSDTAYTITYLPGAQWPTYQVQPMGAYPSHQVIESEGPHKGKTLAEVPAADWATLPELAERPLSLGPYRLTAWEKGQRMVFEANPNFFKGEPPIKTITIQFIADTQQAVAQLLTGNVDILGSETLGAGAEVETVLKEAEAGKIQAETIASPTWEHIDFNLFTR